MINRLRLDRQRGAVAMLLLLLTVISSVTARAQDSCGNYKWDVSKERALFAASATTTASGTDATSAPSLALNRLYQLSLHPSNQVQFPAKPAKQSDSGELGGVARMISGAAGTYRVALGGPFWIDVVVNGQVLSPQDYQGAKGCAAPRKVVEYALPANTPLVLQFSAAPDATLRLTLTLASAAAGAKSP